MKFVSAYDYVPPVGEKMDEHSLVETAGYVPTEKKIQQMMMAGERLLTVTADQYDYSGEYDEDNFDVDPTRSGISTLLMVRGEFWRILKPKTSL